MLVQISEQFQTSDQVELRAESIHFEMGQDLLDWLEDDKPPCNPVKSSNNYLPNWRNLCIISNVLLDILLMSFARSEVRAKSLRMIWPNLAGSPELPRHFVSRNDTFEQMSTQPNYFLAIAVSHLPGLKVSMLTLLETSPVLQGKG